MPDQLSYDDELRLVVDLMRDFSRQTDPQAAATSYSRGLRSGLVPSDEWLAVSRRGLEWPDYRITRSTTWRDAVNPWKDRDRLPLLSGGLLAELIYSDKPALLDDLPARLA